MRIQVAVPVLLAALTVLLLSCGGGAAKKEFAAYDAAVTPLLEEEESLYRKFAELTADAWHYGEEEKASTYLRSKLVPFNAKLAKMVEAIRPESAELSKIHGYLVRYAKLREGYFEAIDSLQNGERQYRERSQPTRERIEDLRAGIQRRGAAIQPAFEAAPELAANLQQTLQQILAAVQRYEQLLAALEQGAVKSGVFLSEVDTRLKPWFKQTRENVAALGATGKGEDLKKAIITFIAGIEELMEASRALAGFRAELEKPGAPDPQRVQKMMASAAKTLATYKEEARAYRNRLR